MSWTVTLYGSNTDESSNYPAISAVTGHTDITSYSMVVLGCYPTYESESEGIKYLGGGAASQQRYRLAYEITGRPIEFPTTRTAVETYYPTNVLSKRFHWVDLSDFELVPASLATTEALAIAIDGVTIEHDETLGKKITIKAISREII